MRVSYSDYLKSPYWKAIRRRILIRDGRRCQCCGSSEQLNVHHRCYDNLGHEFEDDLITWCRGCHAAHHQIDLPAEHYVDGPEPIGDILYRLPCLWRDVA